MPLYQFGEVGVDTDAVEIVGPDGVRDVEPQVFDVLRYLIEQPGRLVTKEELLDNVWGDRFVSESALTTRIKQARRALGDDGRAQWAIKTVHGRGYRFVAERSDPPNVPTGDRDVLDSTAHPSPVPVLPVELRADARQLFLGRESELAEVMEHLATSSPDGALSWAWLLGEPGIGKTRLAAEVARRAQALGHRVLFGRNGEDLRVPHQPFIEIIRSAYDEVDDGERQCFISDLSPELGPLLPGLGIAPTSGMGGVVDDETRRYLLFEAIASWLSDAAADSPLTLIIDDVHWAADSTLQLLGHLQRRKVGSEVNLVLTARDTAPDTNPRVISLLASGQGSVRTKVIRLDGLSGVDAVRIVGQELPLDEVMRQTAGNPLMLQAVNQTDGTVDVQDAVHRRLARLDSGVQEMLQFASVMGLEFELRVAAIAMDTDELVVLDHVEQAIAARLLQDVGVDRFRFAHALVRMSLRDQLSSARRARIHKRIASAIVEIYGDDLRRVPTLAFHTAEAAEADPTLGPVAIARLERAAQESMNQLSFGEAADALARAVELAERDDQSLVARLSLAQGIAETRAGNNMTAAHTFERAMDAATSSGGPELRIEAALRYEDATWRPGLSGAHALRRLAEAAGDLTDVEDENDRGRLRLRLAIARLRALAMSGRSSEVEAEFGDTLDLARAYGSATLEAGAINVYLTQVRLFRGLDGTEPLVARLEELQRDIDDADVALHTVHSRSLYATYSGRFDEVREMGQLMADIQEGSHSSFWSFIRTNHEAMEALYRGDLAGAERLAEDCLALAEGIPEEDGAGTYGLRMFMIRREQDRLASVAPMVRHVLSTGDISGVWTPGLAMLLAETGSHERASELLAEIRAASFEFPVDAMWSTVMVFLIETMVSIGDREACDMLRSRFERLSGTNVTMASGLLCFGSADRYLGMLSLTIGELGAAEEYLGTALETDTAGGSALWANESRLWLARTRREQGHSAEADAMLAVVATEAHAKGLARLERVASRG